MLIIGEKINATRKPIQAALEKRDADHIKEIAVAQAEAGAHYIDVNGGDPHEGKEVENMAWLMETVQAGTDTPICVDTANPEAMKVGLEAAKAKPVLNSISLESTRLESMLPLLQEHECMVIGLLMSDEGPPQGVDDRVANAEKLIEKLTSAGKDLEEIIIDPCFLPVSADTTNGVKVIDAIGQIRRRWEKVQIGGGCSNVSYGLPKRKFINFAFLSQAIYSGLDVALIDPNVPGIMETILAAEALAGRDEFCMNYVQALR